MRKSAVDAAVVSKRYKLITLPVAINLWISCPGTFSASGTGVCFKRFLPVTQCVCPSVTILSLIQMKEKFKWLIQSTSEGKILHHTSYSITVL